MTKNARSIKSKTMGIFRFMRTPTPQKFGYKPRFYNPDKEDLEERLERIRREESDDPEAVKKRIATGFRSRGGYNKEAKFARKRGENRSNIILIGVIVVLILATYIFLEVYLPQIENYLK